MGFRIVVSQALRSQEAIAPLLAAKGCEIVPLPQLAGGWTPALIDSYAREADGFMGAFAGMKVTRDVLAAAEKLRVVASPIIGTEHIDVEAASEFGIVVGFGATPENFLGVAEAVVMTIAALRKHLPQKIEALRGGGWRTPHPGHMVRNSTIGLIGFGNIGQGVARRLAGWECRVLVADPFKTPAEVASLGARLVDLDTLLRESDAVSLLVTLTPQTRHMIGRRELALMKPGAYLINAARGGLVDEPALLQALNDDRLAGAAIDTWEQEPCDAADPLRLHPKVIPTAHNIGHSEEAYASLPVAAVENVWRALHGTPPLYVRNPEVLPKWHDRIARLDRIAKPFLP